MTQDHATLRDLDDRLAAIERDIGDIKLAVDLNLGLYRDLDRARDLARDLAGARDLALYRARARDLARDLARARDLTLTLSGDIDRAKELALLDRKLYRDLSSAQEKRGEIVAVIGGVRLRVQAELAAPTSEATVPEGGVVVSPARSALRVLHGGLRVLPRRHQSRYREELEAELVDLAAAGTSRRAQLAYALGLAGRAWALRRALRAPAPGRARERAR